MPAIEALVRHELTAEESTRVVPFPNPFPTPATVVTRLARRPEMLEKRTWNERHLVSELRVTVRIQDGRGATGSTIDVNRVAPRPLVYASAITETHNDAIVEAATESLLFNPVKRERETTDLPVVPFRFPPRRHERETDAIQTIRRKGNTRPI